MTDQLTDQKPRSTYWQPYVFADQQIRQFFCNAILFNNQGTGNAFINDVFLLQPGDTLALNCDRNEIDETIYKISFTAGFVNKLSVFVKINQGSTLSVQGQLMKMVSPGDRRKQVKEYAMRRNRGDF